MSLYGQVNSSKTRKAGALPGSSKSRSNKGTPRCTFCAAVMTIEAALVLPLLACFFVSILFFFRVMQTQLELQKALDDTARQMAVYLAEEQDSGNAGLAMAKAVLWRELSDREEVKNCISGGKLGVSLLGSRITKDEVQLKAVCQIPLPVQLFWNWKLTLIQKAECRKWTGWNGEGTGGNGDVWVYVTETGQVYHTSNACTYLTLSIQSVDRATVGSLRNEAGGRYEACLLCGDAENAWDKVYITNQGNCYHGDLGCSGIKRTVYMVRLSEAGERGACSRCGAGLP